MYLKVRQLGANHNKLEDTLYERQYIYIGVDYHKKKYSYIVVQDERGKVLKSAQVMNDKDGVAAF